MIYSDLEAEAIIEAVINDKGYSWYDAYNRKRNRRRLQIDKANRPDRIHFPAAMYQKLFNDQKGMCSECQSLLDIPAKRNEIDHKNPNEPRFNERFNLQLLHKSCNREKSAMTIQEQSKASGKPFTDILRTPDEGEI